MLAPLLLALVATHAIDTHASRASFTVSHIFVEHVSGTIPIESGDVRLPSDSAIPTSVIATLDPAGVSTDEPDRDSALRSAEFFDVARYPTWRFVSTAIHATGSASFTMQGNLTIHGVTQPETLQVQVTGDARHPTYRATGTLDRHAFGMSRTRLDPAIGGTVDVTLDITLR